MIVSEYRRPGIVARGHRIEVPLDPAAPAGRTISVFGREVVAPGNETAELPWLVFLQGGPGSPAPRPDNGIAWLAPALEHYRVLLLDQRGTGASSPLTRQTLAGMSAPEAAEYASHFRSDAIVADAEAFRTQLTGGAPWSVLGQSFGGFCATCYLSQHPEGLREVFITGGVPDLRTTADRVYRAAYPRVAAACDRFYARYPDAVDLVRRIVEHLAMHEERLPSGQPLTPLLFQTVGTALGMNSTFDHVYDLLEGALIDTPTGPAISDVFAESFSSMGITCRPNPIYALLHEAEYVEGPGAASRWSAERIRAEFPEFAPAAPGRTLLTGEMIYPWMFDQDPALIPLREAANILAHKDDWPDLYRPDVVAGNEIPVAAAVYYDDLYVDREQSLESLGIIGNARAWVTNEFAHDGLRMGATVFTRLYDMLHGRV